MLQIDVLWTIDNSICTNVYYNRDKKSMLLIY